MQGPECVSEGLFRPNIIAIEIDMLPAEGSDVFKEFIGNIFAITAELFHCSTEIHSIPEGHGGYGEVETRSAVALIFKGSIPQLSMAVKEQRSGQGITGFSFVETGI